MKAVSMQKIGYLTWKLEMDDGRTAMFCITRPALRLIGDVKIDNQIVLAPMDGLFSKKVNGLIFPSYSLMNHHPMNGMV